MELIHPSKNGHPVESKDSTVSGFNSVITAKKKPRGKPFVKGQRSANPKGRPKGSLSIITVVKRLLQETGPDGKQRVEKLAEALILQAAKGNGAIVKQLWDRIDGPVKEVLDVAGGNKTLMVTLDLGQTRNV